MADNTTLSDMIVPEVYYPYVIQETINSNAFINSGIAAADGLTIPSGGKTINLPFFERIENGVEVLQDSEAMTVHKVTTAKDVAVIHARGVTYGASDLARAFSGADAMGAIGSMLADVWAEEFTNVIKYSLDGIFGLDDLADSLNDQSANTLTAEIMVKSMYMLGDKYSKITGIACHSAVLAKLKQLDLIDTIPPSELAAEGYSTYMQKRIIVDDLLEADSTSGAYPVYFFGAGAFSYNESPALFNLEFDRDKLKGIDYIISRRFFTMHPRGVKWLGGTVAGETPSNDELATSSNWELVENRKNVKISKLLVLVD